MATSGYLNTPFDVDIVLDENPQGDATVKLTAASPAGIDFSPNTLSFNETNWNTPQQVSVTLKQNPIELGGQQNTQVLLTETTTSWGGSWNVKKDRITLTVKNLEADTFNYNGEILGVAAPVETPSLIGTIPIDNLSGKIVQVSVRHTDTPLIRGNLFGTFGNFCKLYVKTNTGTNIRSTSISPSGSTATIGDSGWGQASSLMVGIQINASANIGTESIGDSCYVPIEITVKDNLGAVTPKVTNFTITKVATGYPGAIPAHVPNNSDPNRDLEADIAVVGLMTGVTRYATGFPVTDRVVTFTDVGNAIHVSGSSVSLNTTYGASPAKYGFKPAYQLFDSTDINNTLSSITATVLVTPP